MVVRVGTIIAIAGFCVALSLTGASAQDDENQKAADAATPKASATADARQLPLVTLKSGETLEAEMLFWVANCHSELKDSPQVEVLEGPPDLAVSVRPQNVVPRKYKCASAVPGGMLLFTAKEVKARTEGRLVIRIKYPTRDGDRQIAHEYNVILYP